jgi:hypothetical protein
VDPIAAGGQRGGHVEERGLRGAQAVDAEHVGPGAHAQRGDAAAGELDLVDPQQRRAARGQAEHPLEGDRAVDVAPGVQQPLGEGRDARDLAGAQPQPGVGVGADDDVGPAARHALADSRPVRRAADLPRVADVPQAHVVGHVEPVVRAQIPLGERLERLFDLAETARDRDRPDGR